MSNWSSVLICFSGIEPLRAQEIRELAEESVAAMADFKGDFFCSTSAGVRAVILPCGDGGNTLCCETILALDANSFYPEPLIKFLRTKRWRTPEEVQVIYKSENMEGYKTISMEGKK